MPGPKPTPTGILNNRGSWRGKVRKNEPIAKGMPLCPDWLKEDAREHWYYTLQKLANMGIVGGIDEDKLAMYCKFYVLFVEETERTMPNVNDLIKYAGVIDKIGTQFGMSPSARASMTVTPVKDNKDKKKDKFFLQKA